MSAPQPTTTELIDILYASNGKLALRVDHDLVRDSYYVRDNRLKMINSGETAQEHGVDPEEMLEEDVNSEHATIEVVHRSETPWALEEREV
jgi:hypothetical protein